MPAYDPHKAFIAPAHARNSINLVVIGFFVIELVYFYGYALLDYVLQATAPDLLSTFYLGATPLALFAQLASFMVLGGAVVVTVAVLHKRGPLSLIGNLRFALPQFLACFAALIVLLVALEFVPPWWSFDALAEVRNLPTWLALVPFMLLGILIQIGSEELLYRGYVQQQVASYLPHPAVWLIVPNLLFAAAHWDTSAAIPQNAQYVLWAFAFGLAASDLTARAGTLGPAIALHLANNTFAFMLYSEQNGPSSGFALFLFPEGTMGASFEGHGEPSLITWQLAAELGILLLMWLTARLTLKR